MSSDFNIDLVIDDIKEALERERLAEKSIGWSVIFNPSPAIRRMLLLGLLVPVAQQASGIDAIQYYFLDIMEEANISSKYMQKTYLIFFGLLKLICIFISSQIMDRLGRRPTFFISLTGTSLQSTNWAFGLQCDVC